MTYRVNVVPIHFFYHVLLYDTDINPIKNCKSKLINYPILKYHVAFCHTYICPMRFKVDSYTLCTLISKLYP